MTGNGKIDELIAEVFFNEIYIDVGQDQELKYHRDGFDAMFVFFFSMRCNDSVTAEPRLLSLPETKGRPEGGKPRRTRSRTRSQDPLVAEIRLTSDILA